MEDTSLCYQIFQINPLAMIITNIESGKIKAVNRSFLKMAGYTEEELVGKKVQDLNIFIDYKQLDIINKKLKFEERVDNEELFIKNKDGKILKGISSVEKIKNKEEDLYLTVIIDITEKEKLTKQLVEKCEKFTNIVEGANLGTWEWNIQNQEFEFNEQFARALGYSLEELKALTAKTWDTIVEADDYKRLIESLTNHVEGKTEYSDCEIRKKHKDGRWIWFRDRGRIIERDENGQGIKMFGTQTDIDKRKKAEEKLKESEKRFFLALDKTEAGLWDMNLITGEVYLSSMWKKILGYEENEIENRYESWEKLCHPDELEENEKILEEFFNGESEGYSLIHRLKHKDGSWKWILGRGGVLKDKKGNPYRWLGTNIDITEKHEQTIELERVFLINLDLLSIVDMEGRFIKVNKAWKEILGYSKDEIKERKIIDFMHRDDIESTLEIIERLKNGEKIDLFISKYRNKRGKYHYLEWRANPHEGLVYVSARDVTERVRYEKKILEISNKDDLTGAYNRRFIYERAEEMIEEYKRNEKVFSLAIIDIDDFKVINDKFGHQIGDEVLKEFTKIIDENLRPYDILGRYGGEEFIVILNNADREKSNKVLERILNIVRNKTFVFNKNYIRFTFSAGISSCEEFEKDEIIIDKLVEVADDRMYFAKNNGKNEIVYKKSMLIKG